VSEIEKTFGVDASAAVAAPVMMAAAPGAAAAAPAVEEKTTFDVVLEDIPADKKVAIYKVVRGIANIAVNQVKDYTATLPKVLKEGASKEEATDAVRQLTEAGAKAKVA
jgi:large subunit ribosomal protein L7/L12